MRRDQSCAGMIEQLEGEIEWLRATDAAFFEKFGTHNPKEALDKFDFLLKEDEGIIYRKKDLVPHCPYDSHIGLINDMLHYWHLDPPAKKDATI